MSESCAQSNVRNPNIPIKAVHTVILLFACCSLHYRPKVDDPSNQFQHAFLNLYAIKNSTVVWILVLA